MVVHSFNCHRFHTNVSHISNIHDSILKDSCITHIWKWLRNLAKQFVSWWYINQVKLQFLDNTIGNAPHCHKIARIGGEYKQRQSTLSSKPLLHSFTFVDRKLVDDEVSWGLITKIWQNVLLNQLEKLLGAISAFNFSDFVRPSSWNRNYIFFFNMCTSRLNFLFIITPKGYRIRSSFRWDWSLP